MSEVPGSIDAVQETLAEQGYVCGRALGTVVFLALKLGRPVFLEGEAGGFGKTTTIDGSISCTAGIRTSRAARNVTTRGLTKRRRTTGLRSAFALR
jgi:hypothetical protein